MRRAKLASAVKQLIHDQVTDTRATLALIYSDSADLGEILPPVVHCPHVGSGMFRGSKRRASPGRPGGRPPPGAGTAPARPRSGPGPRRSITASATRTGTPAATASFRAYPALTITCRVPGRCLV